MQKAGLIEQRVDWHLVHGRLQANECALEQALHPTPQRIEDTYRRRAVKLAKVEKQNSSTSAALAVLVVRLGSERYAIELKHLAEVLPFDYFAPVPRSTAPFLGIVSVRGELRAVVDLCRMVAPGISRFTALSEKPESSGFVLLLRPAPGGEQIGWKVDSVDELREIRPEEVTRSASGSFVIGHAKDALPILSVDAVLAHVFSKMPSRGGPQTPSHDESNGEFSIK